MEPNTTKEGRKHHGNRRATTGFPPKALLPKKAILLPSMMLLRTQPSALTTTGGGRSIIIVLIGLVAGGCVCSAISTTIRPSIDKSPPTSKFEPAAPALSNFDQRAIPPSVATKMTTGDDGTVTSTPTTVVHKLLNVPMTNGTGTVLLNINLQKMMEDPYVHGIVLPAAVGLIVALVTLLLVCAIRSCVRNQARRRRRRRIRNLAEELKADQKVLLAPESDDEI